MDEIQPILSHRAMLKSMLIGFLIGFVAMAAGQDSIPTFVAAEAFVSN